MSIYDQIGGASSVEAAVELFYDKVLGDPTLAPYFEGVEMSRLKGHQRAFIAAALGGPAYYQGRDMAKAHAALGVTDADFDAVVGHLGDALEELGVSADTTSKISASLQPLRDQIVTNTAKV